MSDIELWLDGKKIADIHNFEIKYNTTGALNAAMTKLRPVIADFMSMPPQPFSAKATPDIGLKSAIADKIKFHRNQTFGLPPVRRVVFSAETPPNVGPMYEIGPAYKIGYEPQPTPNVEKLLQQQLWRRDVEFVLDTMLDLLRSSGLYQGKVNPVKFEALRLTLDRAKGAKW